MNCRVSRYFGIVMGLSLLACMSGCKAQTSSKTKDAVQYRGSQEKGLTVQRLYWSIPKSVAGPLICTINCAGFDFQFAREVTAAEVVRWNAQVRKECLTDTRRELLEINIDIVENRRSPLRFLPVKEIENNPELKKIYNEQIVPNKAIDGKAVLLGKDLSSIYDKIEQWYREGGPSDPKITNYEPEVESSMRKNCIDGFGEAQVSATQPSSGGSIQEVRRVAGPWVQQQNMDSERSVTVEFKVFDKDGNQVGTTRTSYSEVKEVVTRTEYRTKTVYENAHRNYGGSGD